MRWRLAVWDDEYLDVLSGLGRLTSFGLRDGRIFLGCVASCSICFCLDLFANVWLSLFWFSVDLSNFKAVGLHIYMDFSYNSLLPASSSRANVRSISCASPPSSES